MSHLDDESIALAAIGELDQSDGDHLDACEVCRAEVVSLTRVVSIARSTAAADTLVAPPPAVWARIAAETGVDPTLLPASLDARRRARGDDVDQTLAPALAQSGAGRSAPRRTGFLVAASVAGLVLGIGGTLAWQVVQRDGAPVVASATLAALPDKVGSGEAEVVDTSDGLELEISLDTAAPRDSFLQVWLLSSRQTDPLLMVPVGVLAGSTGHWTLPPDVELTDYSIVDVSIEPYDGDPAHSSNSVVRGMLDPSSAAVGALGE